VDPFDALEKHGADAIRWYFYINSAPWLPNRFHDKAVTEGQQKFMSTLWNTYAFFVLYANIDEFDASKYTLDYEKLPVMDKWILSRLNTMVKDVDEDLENYRIPEAARALKSAAAELIVQGYRLKVFDAYMTLYTALVTTAKAVAPMVPFMAESIYRNLVCSVDPSAPESVHLCDFPAYDAAQIDPARINEVTDLIRSLNMGVLIGGSAGAYLDEKCYEELSGYLSGGEADPKKRKAIMFANGMFTEKQRHPKDPIYKLGASLPHGGSFDELIEKLPAPFKLIVTVTSPDGDFAEITDSSITKSSGIREILKVYGADMKDAVGIGDSGNDVDMIEACGLGIAMGNAYEDARKAADWITTDIDDDGIYNAFVHAGVIERE